MKHRLTDDLCAIGTGILLAGVCIQNGWLDSIGAMILGGGMVFLALAAEFAFRFVWGQEYMTGVKSDEGDNELED